MTPTQFQAAIDRLDLSQRGLAAIFGRNERTSRAWASGQSAINPEAAILLRLMLAGKITVDDIKAAKRPR